MVDISNCKLIPTTLDGCTQKYQIAGKPLYMVKLSDDGNLSAYTEYIASHISNALGVRAHETELGVYNGDVVVVVKLFTDLGVLRQFEETHQSSADTDIDGKEYTYDDVCHILGNLVKVRDKERILCEFWDMIIIDTILGNRDRHKGNWGILKGFDGIDDFAPLYDNAGCLFPDVNKVIDEYIDRFSRKKFLYERVYTFPACKFKIDTGDRLRKTNYTELYKDLRRNKLFASRVRDFKDRVSVRTLYDLLVQLMYPLDIHYVYKRFWIEIVCLRYSCIVRRNSFSKEYEKLEAWFND